MRAPGWAAPAAGAGEAGAAAPSGRLLPLLAAALWCVAALPAAAADGVGVFATPSPPFRAAGSNVRVVKWYRGLGIMSGGAGDATDVEEEPVLPPFADREAGAWVPVGLTCADADADGWLRNNETRRSEPVMQPLYLAALPDQVLLVLGMRSSHELGQAPLPDVIRSDDGGRRWRCLGSAPDVATRAGVSVFTVSRATPSGGYLSVVCAAGGRPLMGAGAAQHFGPAVDEVACTPDGVTWRAAAPLPLKGTGFSHVVVSGRQAAQAPLRKWHVLVGGRRNATLSQTLLVARFGDFQPSDPFAFLLPAAWRQLALGSEVGPRAKPLVAWLSEQQRLVIAGGQVRFTGASRLLLGDNATVNGTASVPPPVASSPAPASASPSARPPSPSSGGLATGSPGGASNSSASSNSSSSSNSTSPPGPAGPPGALGGANDEPAVPDELAGLDEDDAIMAWDTDLDVGTKLNNYPFTDLLVVEGVVPALLAAEAGEASGAWAPWDALRVEITPLSRKLPESRPATAPLAYSLSSVPGVELPREQDSSTNATDYFDPHDVLLFQSGWRIYAALLGPTGTLFGDPELRLRDNDVFGVSDATRDLVPLTPAAGFALPLWEEGPGAHVPGFGHLLIVNLDGSGPAGWGCIFRGTLQDCQTSPACDAGLEATGVRDMFSARCRFSPTDAPCLPCAGCGIGVAATVRECTATANSMCSICLPCPAGQRIALPCGHPDNPNPRVHVCLPYGREPLVSSAQADVIGMALGVQAAAALAVLAAVVVTQRSRKAGSASASPGGTGGGAGNPAAAGGGGAAAAVFGSSASGSTTSSSSAAASGGAAADASERGASGTGATTVVARRLQDAAWCGGGRAAAATASLLLRLVAASASLTLLTGLAVAVLTRSDAARRRDELMPATATVGLLAAVPALNAALLLAAARVLPSMRLLAALVRAVTAASSGGTASALLLVPFGLLRPSLLVQLHRQLVRADRAATGGGSGLTAADVVAAAQRTTVLRWASLLSAVLLDAPLMVVSFTWVMLARDAATGAEGQSPALRAGVALSIIACALQVWLLFDALVEAGSWGSNSATRARSGKLFATAGAGAAGKGGVPDDGGSTDSLGTDYVGSANLIGSSGGRGAAVAPWGSGSSFGGSNGSLESPPVSPMVAPAVPSHDGSRLLRIRAAAGGGGGGGGDSIGSGAAAAPSPAIAVGVGDYVSTHNALRSAVVAAAGVSTPAAGGRGEQPLVGAPTQPQPQVSYVVAAPGTPLYDQLLAAMPPQQQHQQQQVPPPPLAPRGGRDEARGTYAGDAAASSAPTPSAGSMAVNPALQALLRARGAADGAASEADSPEVGNSGAQLSSGGGEAAAASGGGGGGASTTAHIGELWLRARTPEGRRLAGRRTFFRRNPHLLPEAIAAVQQVPLPQVWLQVLWQLESAQAAVAAVARPSTLSVASGGDDAGSGTSRSSPDDSEPGEPSALQQIASAAMTAGPRPRVGGGGGTA